LKIARSADLFYSL